MRLPAGSELILSGSQRGPATYAGLSFYWKAIPHDTERQDHERPVRPPVGSELILSGSH
ncbi:MAG: hypothetical protein WAO06_01460 [Tenuifilaceae bacterium]